MAVVPLYFLLSAFVGSSHAIVCNYCWTFTNPENLCRWGSIECPSDYLCSATIFEYYKDISKERTHMFIFNDCMPPSQCNQIGSFSSEQETTWLATACCDTDLCTPNVPEKIRSSSEPNGLTCPVCSSEESLDCEPNGYMTCRGDESNCALKTTDFQAFYDEAQMENYWYGSNAAEMFNRTGTIPFWLRNISKRGCATDSICQFGPQFLGKYSLLETVDHTCTGGTEESSGYPTTLILCLLFIFYFTCLCFRNYTDH